MADIPVRKISRLPAETRNPLFVLRLAARQFLGLLFHEPPRNTRLFNRIPIRRSRDEFHEAGRYAENAARHDARTHNLTSTFMRDQGLRLWPPQSAKETKGKGLPSPRRTARHNHHPQAVGVGADAREAPGAAGRAAGPGIEVPRAATQHAARSS